MVTKLVLTFLILTIATHSLSNNNISNRLLQSTSRTASVTKMCAPFADRKSLIDDQAKADGQASTNAMKGSFSKSGNQIGIKILSSSDKASAALQQIQPMYTQLGFFVGPFALGLIINYFLWLFLCCCCCCPSCCPSKCCQKPETQQYTKFQLLCPSMVLIVALLLMIIASIIGITRAGDVEKSYQAVGCSAAITFDDIANGNISSTGKFFIGLNPLMKGLNDLKTNKNTVKTEMDKLSYSTGGSHLNNAYTAGTAVLTQITKVPDGTAGGSMTAFTYNTFDGSGGSFSSSFPGLLGSVPSPGTPSGAVNASHFAINKINDDVLKKIGQNADNFTSQFGTIDSIVDSAASTIQGFVDQINGFDGMFTGMNSSISPIMSLVTIGITAAFGVFIGLGVLSLIGVLMMACCDKYKCRYLLYFVCTILTILGILCFFLALIFSVLTPMIYFSCDFINTTISSKASFNSNLNNVLDPSLTGMISVCLPGGSGDIVSNLGIDLSAVSGLSGAITQLRSFNSSTVTSGVQTAMNQLQTFINKYYYTDVYDFTDTTSQNFISKIANPVHASYSACASNSFSQDKWVPSTRNTAFSCGSLTAASTTQCTTTGAGGDIQQGRSGPSCYGCLDSTKIIVTRYSPATGATTDLNARYGNPAAGACATWYTDMSALITNYYHVKKQKYGPVQTNMAAVKTLYNTATTGYKDRINYLGSTVFPAVITAMETISTLADPQYGVLSGLNCLLLGQDINLVASTTCAKLFTTFFTLRLTLGITAFAILFIMCCSTCSGVRHYKHSMRKGTILPGDMMGVPQESTMMALNDKKY